MKTSHISECSGLPTQGTQTSGLRQAPDLKGGTEELGVLSVAVRAGRDFGDYLSQTS